MTKLADMEIATRLAYRLQALRNLRQRHEEFPNLELSVRLMDKTAATGRPNPMIAAFEIQPDECIEFLDAAERVMVEKLEALGVTDTDGAIVRTRSR